MKKQLIALLYLLGVSFLIKAMEQNKIHSLEQLCVIACANNVDIIQKKNSIFNNKIIDIPNYGDIPKNLEANIMNTVKISTTNSDTMRAWAHQLDVDFTREQLKDLADILCRQEQAKKLNHIALKNFVLNFPQEQHGKIQFKLLTWFMNNKNSKLTPDHRIYLGWDFLFGQTNQIRKNAVLEDLVTKVKNLDPYVNIIFDSFETKNNTPEYLLLQKKLDLLTDSITPTIVHRKRSIKDCILRLQLDKFDKAALPDQFIAKDNKIRDRIIEMTSQL